jgi:hypothetical protein
LTSLLFWLDFQRPALFLYFFFWVCATHLVAAIYCRRLWQSRIERWEAFKKYERAARYTQEWLIAPDDLTLFPRQSAEGAE